MIMNNTKQLILLPLSVYVGTIARHVAVNPLLLAAEYIIIVTKQAMPQLHIWSHVHVKCMYKYNAQIQTS